MDIMTYAASVAYTNKKTASGGGTTDYNSLQNKPQINNVELSGNKDFSDFGLFQFEINDENASAQNKKIVDVAIPTNPTDAATKQYVDDGLAANRALPRQFDLFGLRPNGTATITLPISRDNVLVIFYNIAPDGTVNVANSKAVRVDKGASATKDGLTVNFNNDGLSFILTSTETTNSILGQYYSYNNI